MNIKQLRQQARERMNGVCRVCPVCDGRACAGELPGMGGIRSGASFMANVEALSQVKLKMRVLHGAASPGTACDLLGFSLAMPVLVAPMAGAQFNMGGFFTEERFAEIAVAGARDAGIVACTGDGTDEAFQCGLAAVARAGGWGIPVVKPWSGDFFFARMDQAAEAGCRAVGMDIDTAAFTALGKSRRPVSPKTPEELRAIVDGAHSRGLKFLLKGVMSPEDARIAEDAGCDALVVSNHGGRVWEALPGTACVLPEVARSVSRLPVLADGGVRSGADVLKMLALGASAVLVGRPCAIASVGGEEEGLVLWLKRLRRQLVESLILAGLADVSDAGPHVIASAPWL